MKIDPISKALNTDHGIDLSTGRVVSVIDHDEPPVLAEKNNEVAPPAAEDAQANDSLEKTQEHIEDETTVKDNIRTLIDKGMDLAEDMFEFVRQSESPKAFEPAAAYLKTLVELNEKLLDVHDRDRKLKASAKKDAKGQQSGQVINNTQNNIIYKQPNSILKRIKEGKNQG